MSTNCEVYGRQGPWRILRHSPQYFVEDVRIRTKTLGNVASTSFEIRTEDSPNTKWDSYARMECDAI